MILLTKLRKNMLNPQPQSHQQRQSFKTKYGTFGSFPGKQFADKNILKVTWGPTWVPPSKLLLWDYPVPAIEGLWPSFNKNSPAQDKFLTTNFFDGFQQKKIYYFLS